MAGLYLHIPFCKQACHYCNFHFSTNQKHQQDFVKAICKELKMRASELCGTTLESIYFGGGTPSLLNFEDLNLIFKTIESHYIIDPKAEITLEANPDDLTFEKTKQLASTQINRLSIGIQSFFDEDLQLMNRAHNAQDANICVKIAQNFFNNISIDLIYGIPKLTVERWRDNLKIALSLGIQHLSCYALTIEPKTALDHLVKTKQYPSMDDELSAMHFDVLVDMLQTEGFVQYEVCSFGKPGYFSKHNSNYWLGKAYLGVGPSAHSFEGKKRSWNVSNNIQYIKAITDNKLPQTSEILTPENRFNEYLMTGLRTTWGISLVHIEKEFGLIFLTELLNNVQKHVRNNTLIIENDVIKISPKGLFFCDGIAADLFII